MSNLTDTKKTKTTFLDLPGEIKNRIESIVLLACSALLCWSERPLNHRRWMRSTKSICCFSVGRPSLIIAYRETLRDVPSIYYEENTFLFSDGTMSPAAIATFERLCGPSAVKIRSLKVNHRPELWHRSKLYHRFEVKAASNGIGVYVGKDALEISDLKAWKVVDKQHSSPSHAC